VEAALTYLKVLSMNQSGETYRHEFLRGTQVARQRIERGIFRMQVQRVSATSIFK